MSDSTNAAEQSIELEKLLIQMSNALTSTVEALDSAFTHRPGLAESDIIYRIPKMSVSIQMKLSVSKGKVRGIFWDKSRSDSSQEVASSINLDFVAMPRSLAHGAWRDLAYTVPPTVGEDVRIMQMKLERYFELKGMRVPVALDGEYGLQTQDAVSKFRLSQGLPIGSMDRKTYDLLLKWVPDPAPLRLQEGQP